MNQAEVSKLISKLRVKVPPRPRKLSSPKGPEGRLDKLRKTVTGLIKYERIELNLTRGDEARQYAERVSIPIIPSSTLAVKLPSTCLRFIFLYS